MKNLVIPSSRDALAGSRLTPRGSNPPRVFFSPLEYYNRGAHAECVLGRGPRFYHASYSGLLPTQQKPGEMRSDRAALPAHEKSRASVRSRPGHGAHHFLTAEISLSRNHRSGKYRGKVDPTPSHGAGTLSINTATRRQHVTARPTLVL